MEKIEKIISEFERFIQEYDHIIGLTSYNSEMFKGVLTLLKEREPEALDTLKSDSDIGCWYDITHNYTLEQVVSALKAQEPRVMTWNEVKKKINSGEYVFTECEKEGQWMRYGNAKLAIDQGDSCRIAFLSSGDRENNPHALWWWISYKNYNKTWRCWTPSPTYAQMKATPWVDCGAK